MKLKYKNIVFGIILLMGMVVSYGVFIQCHGGNEIIEFSTADNSNQNSVFADNEIHEDDHYSNLFELKTIIPTISNPKYIHLISRSTCPLSYIWQPPKLS